MAFEAGQWNVVCSRCGCQYKARQLRLEWNGLRVCSGPGTNDCWDPKHPQMSVTGKADKQAPPWTQPEGIDRFIGTDVPPITQADL